MGHGPIRTLGSIIRKLSPGDIFYPLNSQEPLVVVFIMENAVITNTAEVFLAHRPIRCCGEWQKEFLINWEGFLNSDKIEMTTSPFDPAEFVDGMVVIILSEDKTCAEVVILVSKDDEKQVYITDDGIRLPYSIGERILPTGMSFPLDNV